MNEILTQTVSAVLGAGLLAFIAWLHASYRQFRSMADSLGEIKTLLSAATQRLDTHDQRHAHHDLRFTAIESRLGPSPTGG